MPDDRLTHHRASAIGHQRPCPRSPPMPISKPLSLAGLILAILASDATAQDSLSAKPAYHVLGGDRGKITLVDPADKVEWQYPVDGTPHDIARLANGNV